jgi:hypothetical protein
MEQVVYAATTVGAWLHAAEYFGSHHRGQLAALRDDGLDVGNIGRRDGTADDSQTPEMKLRLLHPRRRRRRWD